MEINEEKMKRLLECGQKVDAVEFGGELYFVVERGKLTADESFSKQKDYLLYDKKFEWIGFLYLCQQKFGKELIASAKKIGCLSVPKLSVSLSHIEVDEKYRGKHLGDFLINRAVKDVQKLSKDCGTPVPIMFERENSAITVPFYKKWGAENNKKDSTDETGFFNSMIIKKPTPKTEYDGKILKEICKIEEKNAEGRNF